MRDALRGVRPTARGGALGGLGLATTVMGTLTGVRILTQVGSLLLLVVVVAVAWLAAEVRQQDRGRLRLVRRVTPHPVSVGRVATVRVELTASGGAHRLDRLQIAERAARELSGPTALRARVQRSAGRLALTYSIHPQHRGRWPVGPLEVQRRDLFGVARWTGSLAEPMLVAVRPATTPLGTSSSAASTDVDRASAGARTPAADDSSLRDYRAGDDLRRVHWRNSARRGQLMVRQDERAGRRPASVLLDLPLDDEAAEWTISTGASIALALMSAGHHVRLLGGDVLGAATDHHRADGEGAGADALLDQTVDLTRPSNLATRAAWLRTAVDTLTVNAGGAELVFAVVGELEPDDLASLARIGDASMGWAMVRTGRGGDNDSMTADEARTLRALRRAGWTACAVRPGEDAAVCWQRLLDSDERVGVAR
ncbi:DUF58 domain-containing protein [Actinotalea ferrariae]|uniref:DUF58 domain-containing protein n=1 Tax=Actinotalea ferrariae TaxID=1386098 RepID=UPI001C8C4B24|nr:DUF58 domain-containing protein [Actinotalea ferrariae]MBX9246476.1 DUF58 domain-containing protein [Actinotalea ferrariae]